MDTNRIKKFATEARNKLKAGIAAKIITLGFDKNGNVPEHMHPQLMQGGSLWNGNFRQRGSIISGKLFTSESSKRVSRKCMKKPPTHGLTVLSLFVS